MPINYTKGKYLRDPQYHLDRALFFYYNQNPTYPPYKPCSSSTARNLFRKTSYYDKCPHYYYKVCDKISGIRDDDDYDSDNYDSDNDDDNYSTITPSTKAAHWKCNCGC